MLEQRSCSGLDLVQGARDRGSTCLPMVQSKLSSRAGTLRRNRKAHQLGGIFRADLLHDIDPMALDGAWAQIHAVCDLLGRPPPDQLGQNFPLANRERRPSGEMKHRPRAPGLPRFQSCRNPRNEVVAPKWLLDEIKGALLHGADSRHDVAAAGHHDDGPIKTPVPEFHQYFQPREVIQNDIDEHAGRIGVEAQCNECLRIAAADHVEPRPGQHQRDRLADRGFVIQHQNRSGRYLNGRTTRTITSRVIHMLYAKRSVLMLAESREALHRRLNMRGSSARLIGSNQSAKGEIGADLWRSHSPPQTCIRGTVSTIGKLPRASGSPTTTPRLRLATASKQSCRSDA